MNVTSLRAPSWVHRKLAMLRCAAGVLLALAAAANQVAAATYYLATNGNDSPNNGSLSSPWYSINRAMQTMKAGDVLQVRGGRYYYNTMQTINKGGSATWTQVVNYAGEYPILDYRNVPLPFNPALPAGINISVSNVYVAGLRLENGYAISGIKSTGSNITIYGCAVYWFGGSGIWCQSPTYQTSNALVSNITIQSCTVQACVQTNNPANAGWIYVSEWRQKTPPGGWPFALGISNASSASILGNTVWENYGEGIDMLRCSGNNLNIKNNTSKDNFSINIYLDNVQGSSSRYVDVNSNTTNNTNSTTGIYANLKRSGYNAKGIVVETENYETLRIPSAYIAIQNNTANNSAIGYGVGQYTPASYAVHDVAIYNNAANGTTFNAFYAYSPTYNVYWTTNYINGVAKTGANPQ
jgi:hypothetical protein